MPAGRFDESGAGEVPQRDLSGGRVEWAQLGHRTAVDRDDHPLAVARSADYGGHLIAKFSDADSLDHGRHGSAPSSGVAQVYTIPFGNRATLVLEYPA